MDCDRALALNLAIGGGFNLGSARASDKQDTVYPNLELFASVLEKCARNIVEAEPDVSRSGLLVAQGHGRFSGSAQRNSWTWMITSNCRTTRKDSSAGSASWVSMRDSYVTVVAPMEDTPGFRAGILSGDRNHQKLTARARKNVVARSGEIAPRRAGHAGESDHTTSVAE